MNYLELWTYDLFMNVFDEIEIPVSYIFYLAVFSFDLEECFSAMEDFSKEQFKILMNDLAIYMEKKQKKESILK